MSYKKPLEIFIFDQILGSFVSSDQIANLESTGLTIHRISKKCKIADYRGLKNTDTDKLLCINPDFVDWKFYSEDYRDIPGLKAIISTSDNIGWLDTAYADSHGIQYIALKNLTSEYSAVAEYAIAIMMSLARQIPALTRAQFPLDFAHDFVKYQGIDLAGKTAGIIGLGNIGGAIAQLCSGLGMKVLYWSRSKKDCPDYVYAEIDEIMCKSNVVFPTLKPNEQTKLVLTSDKLELLSPDAIVVCVVSGLVDVDYLARRVAAGKLFGFGFGAEPRTFNNYSGNVWAVPDYAWATKHNMEAMEASYAQFWDVLVQATDQMAL